MTVIITAINPAQDPVGGTAPESFDATILWTPDSEQGYQKFLAANPVSGVFKPTRLTFLMEIINNS